MVEGRESGPLGGASWSAGRNRPARWGWAWLDLATYPAVLLLLAPFLWRLASIVAEFLRLSFIDR